MFTLNFRSCHRPCLWAIQIPLSPPSLANERNFLSFVSDRSLSTLGDIGSIDGPRPTGKGIQCLCACSLSRMPNHARSSCAEA
ncbi:uncharacterized protein BDW70DRAFT_145012 [Aspergillus foveolatus]|uniref:uncharacterized protein n=1 Tax=Aspergillus foveolatus TaxID=210207 RepID=UPI003CCD6639